MSPTFRRRYGIALIAMICTAVFTLTWVAGWLVSAFLLGVVVICVAAGYGAWRLLPTTETEADRMAREAVKLSGIHPAGRGRVTNPADAAPVASPAVAEAAGALEVDPADLRMGLRFDEADILHLMGAVKAEQWQAWSDSATAQAKSLAARIYRKHMRSVKRGRR